MTGSRTGRLLAAAMLSAALAPLNSTMIAVALPEIAKTSDTASGILRQALITSFLLTSICLQGPGGKWSDRLGHHRALALGQVLLGTGAITAWLWPELTGLTLGRIVMASGAAILLPSATALLRTEIPMESRGRAFGTLGAVMGLAAGLGPAIGSFLVAHFGWSSVFLANLPILGLSAALSSGRGSVTTQAPSPSLPAFDFFGSALLSLSLLGVALGLEQPDLRWAAWSGLLGLGAFALWERRASDPVVDLSLFTRRAFLFGSLIIALQSLALYATLFELPQVAGRLFAVGPREVGHVLLAMTATMVVASLFAGRLTDRFGARSIALLGCGVTTAGMSLLMVQTLNSLSDATIAMSLLGAGMGLASAPAHSAAMSDARRDESGMAAGVIATMRNVGSVAGLTVLGMVLTDSRRPDTILHEHALSLAWFAGALVLSVGCALLLPPQSAESGESRRWKREPKEHRHA